jgi:hypothetical protein
MINNIYAVTSIYTPNDDDDRWDVAGLPEARCFGVFFLRYNANKAIKKNYGEMQECFYNYSIVERIPSGIHRLATITDCYKWINNRWTRLDKDGWPRFLDTCNGWCGIG